MSSFCVGLTCHCVNTDCQNLTCTRINFYSYCDISIDSERKVFQGCDESVFEYQACNGELDFNPTAHIPYYMCCRTDNCNSFEAIQQLIDALFTSSQVSPSSSLPVTTITPTSSIQVTRSIQVTTAHFASVQLTGMFSFLSPFSLSTITYKLFI